LTARVTLSSVGHVLVSDLPALRSYWYPVAYADSLTTTPRRVEMFETALAVWRAHDGTARAALDACPHRGARLTQGWREGECVVCPYHGWQFDDSGRCVLIPQNGIDSPVPSRAHLTMVHADERYGLVWVCLEANPRQPIPVLPELEDSSYTLVHEFMEEWAVCAPRCMDNALDVSHLSFVHRHTVGDASRPEMSDFTVEREGTRLRFSVSYQATVTEAMRRNTGLTGTTTRRTTHAELVQPLVFRGVLAYENGLRHVLYKTATPLDDHRTLFCQFIARNDAPDAERQRLMIDIDRRIQAEDRELLEGLPSDFPVDLTAELHTRADRMTVEYRRILTSLATST
jgi:phenylpropionate dioxygenase-like ring-hydroxylating dioxygenase large terminal subunit